MMENNIPREVVKEQLGHTSLAMTNRYIFDYQNRSSSRNQAIDNALRPNIDDV